MEGDNFISIEDKDKESNEDFFFEVETEGILNIYEKDDIRSFVYDLFTVFSVMKQIDMNYSDTDSFNEKDIRTFKELIVMWNIKYKDMIFSLIEMDLGLTLDMFLQDDMKNVVILAKNMNRFLKVKKYNEKSAELIFEHFYTGEEELLLLKKEKNKVRVISSFEDMLDPKEPGFRLCTFYGLKGGYDKKIDMIKFAERFSFSHERDKKDTGWISKNPKVTFTTWEQRGLI